MKGMIIGGVCLLILIVAVWRGHRNGFLRTAFSMVALVVSILLVGALSPVMRSGLEATPIPKMISSSIRHNMEKTLDQVLTDNANDLETTMTGEEQEEWLKVSHIPSWIREQIQVQAGNTAQKVVDDVSDAIAGMLVNVGCYVFTLLIVFVLIELISGALGIVNYIPVLGGINRTLGAALGLIQGLFVLWVLSMLVTVFMPSDWGGQLVMAIEDTPVLSWLYHALLSIGRG